LDDGGSETLLYRNIDEHYYLFIHVVVDSNEHAEWEIENSGSIFDTTKALEVHFGSIIEYEIT
jgi:hypothetical protein